MIEKVLSNEKYVFRRINTKKPNFYIEIDYVNIKPIDRLMALIKTKKLQRHKKIIILQKDLYITAWETELEPIFDNPIPYQDPNVIDSRGFIENNTPADPGNPKIIDDQNLIIGPVIDQLTSRDAGHSTVTEQNPDLTSGSHAKGNQVLADPTEINNTEYTNDTLSTLETNNLPNGNIKCKGNYNLRKNPQPKSSDIYFY